MMYYIDYTSKAMSDLEKIKKSGDKILAKKIEDLKEELKTHPRTGTGKPEQLIGDYTGLYSRRITQKHRLIYEILDDQVIVLVISVLGHYGDK